MKSKTKRTTTRRAPKASARRTTTGARRTSERRDDTHGPMRTAFEAAVDLAATTVKEAAALGVVAGRAAGRMLKENAARMMQPKAEVEYWKKQYKKRPYYQAGKPYAFYQAAYRYGYESAHHYTGKNFEDVADQLRIGWEDMKDQSTLTWEAAREAVRDAWNRAMEGRR